MSCKLFLVPEDVIQTWRQTQRQDQVDKPETTVIANMDRQMQSVLKNKKLEDYDKEKLYTQQLGKYVQMRKQSIQKPQLPSDILQTVPKLYQTKAQAFLKYIQNDPDIAWDDQGQLVLKGKTISKSHIVDLLHDALRQRKKAKRAEGWQEISSHLREKNIPQELIGNETWRETTSSPQPQQKQQQIKPTPSKRAKLSPHKKPKFSYTPGKLSEWIPIPSTSQSASPKKPSKRLNQPLVGKPRLPRQSKQRGREKIREWISVS